MPRGVHLKHQILHQALPVRSCLEHRHERCDPNSCVLIIGVLASGSANAFCIF